MNKTELKKRNRLLASLKRSAKLSDAQLKSLCAEALTYIEDLECQLGAFIHYTDVMDVALHNMYKDIAVMMKPKKKPKKKASARRPRRVARVGASRVLH